jgi:hypothetical protein
MLVRTNEPHPFSTEEAEIDQFTVNTVPHLDYASRALREAQDTYFSRYPEARKYAADLKWEIHIDNEPVTRQEDIGVERAIRNDAAMARAVKRGFVRTYGPAKNIL